MAEKSLSVLLLPYRSAAFGLFSLPFQNNNFKYNGGIKIKIQDLFIVYHLPQPKYLIFHISFHKYTLF
jgi:hypothetical protein